MMQNGVDNKHLCPHCGKGFKKRSQIIIHIRSHTGEKPFVCDICGKAFTQNGGMKAHKKIHSQIKAHTCDICEQSFTDKSTLKRHILRHIGERNYICKICNKGFTTDSSLHTHLSSHRGENPFACNVCGRSFLFRQRLNKHIRTVHLKIKRYACEICGKLFAQGYNLTKHLKLHQKPHVCEFCSKAFASEDFLSRHLLKHNPESSPSANYNTEVTNDEITVPTDENPVCNICNKKLKCIVNLKKHMKTHERNLYECQICDKNFICRSRFRAHVKRHRVEELSSTGSEETVINEETFLESVGSISDINNELLSECVENTTELSNEYTEDNSESVNSYNEQTLDTIETVVVQIKEEIVENLQTFCEIIQDEPPLEITENSQPFQKVTSIPDSCKCEICNKEFTSQRYLKRHMKIHNENAFKCAFCGKKFLILQRFNAHLSTHRDKKCKDTTNDITENIKQLEPENSSVIKEEKNQIFIKEEMVDDIFVGCNADDTGNCILETENTERLSIDADPLVY